MTRQCGHCGKPFELVYESATKRGRGRFCSTACYHASTRKDPVEEFHKRYEVSETGCWLWTGAFRSRGYGCLSTDGRGAHRFSLQLANRFKRRWICVCLPPLRQSPRA